jgi:NAD(P)H-dependent FMN reductase
MQDSVELNTAVIYGSVRSDRQGIRAARFVARKLKERGHAVTLVDPLEHKMPLLDLMYKEYETGTAPEAIETVGRILKEADAFIIVTGEYNHSVPPALTTRASISINLAVSSPIRRAPLVVSAR